MDRKTKRREKEEIYGEWALALLYGRFGFLLRPLLKWPLLSKFYGWLQNRPRSAKKIIPFIEHYKVDAAEFEKPVTAFISFNDFFTRKLKNGVRPIGTSTVVMPADGRYTFWQNLKTCEGFFVKGKFLCLKRLLGSASLAERYSHGSMIMARLCPTDYHRFHFPLSCEFRSCHLINGPLASVNPVALAHNVQIVTENRRFLSSLITPFGEILMIEVGATNVGSIIQTASPPITVDKGAEKGFFAFGGSAILLLFPQNCLVLEPDLLHLSAQGIEVRCSMGENLGNLLKQITAN